MSVVSNLLVNEAVTPFTSSELLLHESDASVVLSSSVTDGLWVAGEGGGAPRTTQLPTLGLCRWEGSLALDSQFSGTSVVSAGHALALPPLPYAPLLSPSPLPSSPLSLPSPALSGARNESELNMTRQ